MTGNGENQTEKVSALPSHCSMTFVFLFIDFRTIPFKPWSCPGLPAPVPCSRKGPLQGNQTMNSMGSSWLCCAAPCAVPSLLQPAWPCRRHRHWKSISLKQGEKRDRESSEGTTVVSDLPTRVRGKITRKDWRLVMVTAQVWVGRDLRSSHSPTTLKVEQISKSNQVAQAFAQLNFQNLQ